MPRYTISEFVEQNQQRDLQSGVFELESDRILELNLNGDIWTKMGSMISYRGDVKFTREGILEHGFGKFLKKAFTNEGTALTKASGNGKVYLADEGKKIIILQLQDESIFVNGNDILAFEPSINWDIKMMKRVNSIIAGGLFNIKLQGTGMVAITSHYDPLVLRVAPGNPLVTDPNATVAWSGNLDPELKLDVSLKSFFGRGSGESIQMNFNGEGFVVVQPFEEVAMQQTPTS